MSLQQKIVYCVLDLKKDALRNLLEDMTKNAFIPTMLYQNAPKKFAQKISNLFSESRQQKTNTYFHMECFGSKITIKFRDESIPILNTNIQQSIQEGYKKQSYQKQTKSSSVMYQKNILNFQVPFQLFIYFKGYTDPSQEEQINAAVPSRFKIVSSQQKTSQQNPSQQKLTQKQLVIDDMNINNFVKIVTEKIQSQKNKNTLQ